MAILAECDICGNQHRVKDALVGKSICCKDCGVQFVVPSDNVITPETFFEENGRLYRREPVQPTGLVPRIVSGLVATLVIIALVGVIWAITMLVRPAPRHAPAGTIGGLSQSCHANPSDMADSSVEGGR